jgi:hypothetical protein
VALTANIDKVEQGADGSSISWFGDIDGGRFSSFVLVVTGEIASGNFRTADGHSYQLRYASPGVFAVREIEEAAHTATTSRVV